MRKIEQQQTNNFSLRNSADLVGIVITFQQKSNFDQRAKEKLFHIKLRKIKLEEMVTV